MNDSRAADVPAGPLPTLHPEAGADLSGFLSAAALYAPEHPGPPPSAEHLPFVFWLCDAVRPRLAVVAGAREPAFHFALCQAVAAGGIDARCHLVGLSREPAGTQRERQLRTWAKHQNALYPEFAHMSADAPEDPPAFAEGSIDLLVLHADGGQTTTTGDWYRRLQPALTPGAVVVVHGANGDTPPLGEETDGLPTFRFDHGGGLQVVATGPEVPAPVRHLCSRSGADAQAVRTLFARLGLASRQAVDARRLRRSTRRLNEATAEAAEQREERGLALARLAAQEDELDALRKRVEHHRGLAAAEQRRVEDLQQTLARMRESGQEQVDAQAEKQRADGLRGELDAILNSRSWRATAPLRRLLGGGR